MSFAVGEMVGPYRIIEQLGQGGMATVYKAYHASLDRYVALKVLHPAFNEDKTFLARFQREARVVAKLEHANIVPIYDYAEHEERPYLVMKFIEGETLKARLVRAPIDPNEILRIVEAVGTGLQFAHKRGILHRDIKPSNVLLSTDGDIYLADFGLARIAQTGESTLTSDMILGTPQYISPEQALGKKDLDEGTDIYSFGVMLYELAVGRVPFSADTPFSIIHDHIYSPLPMPRQINPSVSDDVERVLLKALAKDRVDRFKDVQSLIEAFKHAWKTTTPPQPVAPDTQKIQPTAPPVHPVAPTVTKTTPIATSGDSLTIDTPLPSSQVAQETRHQELWVHKRKFPWMWIAASFVVLVMCVIGVLALRSLPTPMKRGTPEPIQETLIPYDASVPTELDLAIQAVEKTPDDPYANLELVLAYLHTNQTENARQVFDTAISLGKDDRQFYLDAGELLAKEESWLFSARMYLRAAEVIPDTPFPESSRINFHEAIYKAFILPEAREIIPYESIGNVDKPLMYIARARYSFYNVDESQGWSSLADLETFKPDTFEVELLRGEFYSRSDKPRDARVALNELLVTPELPEWIRMEAQKILDLLP